MARTLTKEEKDMVKRSQGWKCKNPKCDIRGGRSIKSSGHIHHKDGNPENNRPRNLVALCVKCHRAIKHPHKPPLGPDDPRWWLT